MSNNAYSRSTALIRPLHGGVLVAIAWLVSTSWTDAGTWPASRPTLGTEPTLVEGAVVAACSLVLVWMVIQPLAAGTTSLVAAMRRHRAASGRLEPRRSRPRPLLACLLVTGAAGAVVAGLGPLAAAADGPRLPDSVEGLQVPDRAYGGVRTHRVRAGESLWSISEALLRPGADVRTTARAWPRLHRLNRDRIGADPHSIRPRTLLRLPVWAPTGGPRT